MIICMKQKKFNKAFWAGVIGNVLEHFDIALYGMLAPFMATTFFNPKDEVGAIIKTYLIAYIGIIIKPISTIYFSRLAINYSARKALIISITGIAFSTGAIAFLPTYDQVGSLAAVLLLIVRIFQGIFAAGEQAVAPFFILSNVEQKKYTRVSGVFNSSTMFGVILASLAATLVSSTSDPKFYWRVAFGCAFLTGLGGILLRYWVIEESTTKDIKINFSDVLKILNKHKVKLLRVICVSSLSYVTYSIPFVFFNTFIPLITNIELRQMLEANTMLLLLDTSLILVLSIVVEKYNRRKFLGIISLILAVTVIPLFSYLEGSSYLYVIIVRLWVICLGLAFLVPLQAWYYNLFEGNERFIITGIGSNIASDLVGRPCPGICLALWQYFNHTAAPACFVAIIAIIASVAILTTKADKETA